MHSTQKTFRVLLQGHRRGTRVACGGALTDPEKYFYFLHTHLVVDTGLFLVVTGTWVKGRLRRHLALDPEDISYSVGRDTDGGRGPPAAAP